MLDSPLAMPIKSVPRVVESKADAKILDSLGALKLQDFRSVNAGGALADDSKENVTHGHGREIKERMMHMAKEEKREDDAVTTVKWERRCANDQVQKQRKEEEEAKLKGEATAEEEEMRRAEAEECGRWHIKEAWEGLWEETVANKCGREFKEGMRVGEEEMREDDYATATIADERRQANERLQKQQKEEEVKL